MLRSFGNWNSRMSMGAVRMRRTIPAPTKGHGVPCPYQNQNLLNLKELETTETELNAMAAEAIIGLSRIPKNG